MRTSKLFLPLLLVSLAAAGQTTLPNGPRITPTGVTTQLAPFPFALAVRPDGAQIVAPSIGRPFALNIVDEPASAQPRVHRIPAGPKNDPNLGDPNMNLSSPDFGQITNTVGTDFGGARAGQIAARIEF